MTTYPSATRPWLAHYPVGVPHDVSTDAYESISQMMDENFHKFADHAVCSFMGKAFSYRAIQEESHHLASYLQQQGIRSGDRVAIMMVNVPQYISAVSAVLRIGAILVNVNPLYTPHELEHQLKDSGARAIIVLENFAKTLEACISKTPVEKVIIATIGDKLGLLKGSLTNFVLRRVRKAIPAYHLPLAVTFNAAIAQGAQKPHTPHQGKRGDIAVLQYTGGTTGVSKGAALSNNNIIANTLQAQAWIQPALSKMPEGQIFNIVTALPLYHIFAFTVSMLFSMRMGGKSILIPNPRDLAATLKELSQHEVVAFPAVNTLFNGLVHHPDFKTVDWSHLRLSMGGGMAVQSAVAQKWLEATGCAICEGYGLSETSPIASVNPADCTAHSGTIGLPICSTNMKCIDDEGQEVPIGSPGEICIKGPQVMQGYWQRPDETAKVMTADGYFKSGDIGIMDVRGYIKIVDRKKDMILVSGFNVYPNEIEDVVASMPAVLDCAAVSVPDERTGEAVKLVVVKRNATLTEEAIRDYCSERLTAYKRPKVIEFRSELPKTPVGKILRRELR